MPAVSGGALLLACVAAREGARAERFRCVITPHDMVACNLVEDTGEPAPR